MLQNHFRSYSLHHVQPDDAIVRGEAAADDEDDAGDEDDRDRNPWCYPPPAAAGYPRHRNRYASVVQQDDRQARDGSSSSFPAALWLLGGWRGSVRNKLVNDLWRLDLITLRWRRIASLADPSQPARPLQTPVCMYSVTLSPDQVLIHPASVLCALLQFVMRNMSVLLYF